jgi:hypothetical protein
LKNEEPPNNADFTALIRASGEKRFANMKKLQAALLR